MDPRCPAGLSRALLGPSLVSSDGETRPDAVRFGLLKKALVFGRFEGVERAAWTGTHHEEPESQVQKDRREYRGVSDSVSAHARWRLRQMINGRLSQPRGGLRGGSVGLRGGSGGQRRPTRLVDLPEEFSCWLMTPPLDGNRLILK